jgi:hypothetical protein
MSLAFRSILSPCLCRATTRLLLDAGLVVGGAVELDAAVINLSGTAA